MMSLKGIKRLGFFVAVVVIGGSFASCKGSHELCPAYTKAVSQVPGQEI